MMTGPIENAEQAFPASDVRTVSSKCDRSPFSHIERPHPINDMSSVPLRTLRSTGGFRRFVVAQRMTIARPRVSLSLLRLRRIANQTPQADVEVGELEMLDVPPPERRVQEDRDLGLPVAHAQERDVAKVGMPRRPLHVVAAVDLVVLIVVLRLDLGMLWNLDDRTSYQSSLMSRNSFGFPSPIFRQIKNCSEKVVNWCLHWSMPAPSCTPSM